MKTQLFISSLFLLPIFSPLSVFATGASYVYAEMNPVSVNDNGEILCRTRFIQNGMGARWYDKIEYGLCIISNGKIIEYKTKVLDNRIIDDSSDRSDKGITGEEYMKLMAHWDWIYKTGLDFNNLSKQQKQICEQYGFKENNTEKFRIDKKMRFADFEEERNINLKQNKQLALKGAKSISYSNQCVHILYDFGNIIIFNNAYSENPTTDAGACFSYVNPILGGIEYEYYRITGALFLNQ